MPTVCQRCVSSLSAAESSRTRLPGGLSPALRGDLCAERVAICFLDCVAAEDMLLGLRVGVGKGAAGLQEHWSGCWLADARATRIRSEGRGQLTEQPRKPLHGGLLGIKRLQSETIMPWLGVRFRAGRVAGGSVVDGAHSCRFGLFWNPSFLQLYKLSRTRSPHWLMR